MTASDQPRDGHGTFGRIGASAPDPSVLDSLDSSTEMTWADMVELLQAVAERLDPENPVDLVIVGGSALAAHGLRDATKDIEVITPIPAPVANTIAEVAQSRVRRHDWMNSHAAPFAPLGYETAVVFQHGPLTVRSVSPDDLFRDETRATRPQDLEDLRSLWPHCKFESAEEAVADFDNRTSLSPKDHDPHLSEWIRERVIGSTERTIAQDDQ